jgi:hypothetical protein
LTPIASVLVVHSTCVRGQRGERVFWHVRMQHLQQHCSHDNTHRQVAGLEQLLDQRPVRWLHGGVVEAHARHQRSSQRLGLRLGGSQAQPLLLLAVAHKHAAGHSAACKVACCRRASARLPGKRCRCVHGALA